MRHTVLLIQPEVAMNSFIKIIVLLPLAVSLILCAPAGATWFNSGASSEHELEGQNGEFSTLPALADAIAAEFAVSHAGLDLKLYMDVETVHEDRNNQTLPFTGMLVNELTRSLSSKGFTFEGTFIEHADYKLSVTYHRTKDKVAIYPKFLRTKDGSYHSLKRNYEIALDKIPQGSFDENIDTRLTRLVQKLCNGLGEVRNPTVMFAPIIESRAKYTSPFSDFVANKLKASFADLCMMKVIEAKPILKKSASRSLSKKSGSLPASGLAMADADTTLEGAYLRSEQDVSLSLTLKELSGKVLSAAEESIPRSLVKYSLDNDEAEALSQIADTQHENSNGMVKVGTLKGGGYQVYREGEVVQFTIQVARPLYIYAYDINPNGEVSLLYPKQNEAEEPKQAGIIYTLPELTDSWEIKVEPPYGKDAVKIFASDRKLPIPVINGQIAARAYTGGTRSLIGGTRALSRVNKVQKELTVQPAINGLDLVDYYKGVAAAKKAPLYESTVFVETKPL